MILMENINITQSTKNFIRWFIDEKRKYNAKSSRKDWYKEITNNKKFIKCKNEIEHYYIDGYGLKIIARSLYISYSQLRHFFNIANIDIRAGRDVVTKQLKKFRSIKAYKEKTFVDWPHKYPTIMKNNNRGLQGYYWNKTFQKYVWLRSTYEYIYAKWLDNKNIFWDVECFLLKTTDGQNYRPDFFIFDDNLQTIKYIVEIKGYYDKYNRLKHENCICDFEIILVDNIKNYLLNNTTEAKEREAWRTCRIMNL